MKITLHLTEIKGIPCMDVSGCSYDKGDSIRLMNWGREREMDLRALCKVHRSAVDEALKLKCTNPGALRTWGWRDLWRRVLEIYYGEGSAKTT